VESGHGRPLDRERDPHPRQAPGQRQARARRPRSGAGPRRVCRVSCVVHHADWLDFAPLLPPASIDLLYADPPFNTGAAKSARAGSYDDSFPSTSHYLAWLNSRLVATLPALRPSASVLIHVDWRTSHRVRVLLDDL